MLSIAIPGREPTSVEHLVLDVNGTLTESGALLPGVAERLARLQTDLHVVLLTADTFGMARGLAEGLGVELHVLQPSNGGEQKQAFVQALGPKRVIAIGNGANDAAMLKLAALGLAVVQAEGAAVSALLSADAVFRSICDALDALLAPARLVATLRD